MKWPLFSPLVISQSYGNDTAKQWICCEFKERKKNIKVSQGEQVKLLSTVMALEYSGIVTPMSGT